MTQIKTGNQAEEYVAQHFMSIGAWATIIPKKVDGSQPLDLIAQTKYKTYYLDVKHTARELFPFSRIEENQKLSMKKLYELRCKHTIIGFAFVYKNDIYIMPYEKYIEYLNQGFKSVRVTNFEKFN